MSCAYSEFSFHFLFCSPTARPLPNFIERRDRVEVVERVGPLSAARICSGANTAGKQDLPSYRTAADQSTVDSLSRQTVHVLDGGRREITTAAEYGYG